MKELYEEFLETHLLDKLPLNYDSKNKGFKDCLIEELVEYKKTVKSSGILDLDQKAKLHTLIDGISEALNCYYLGETSKAYKEFRRGVNAIKSELLVLSNETVESQKLYRIRLSEDADSNMLSCEEMFHIPFEKRHLVSTQRFSIPGLPAIYLGSSLYVCWEELGRPNFKNIKASLYKYQKQLDNKIINLGLSFSELREACNRQEKKRENNSIFGENDIFSTYCLVWPLIAACSVKVKEKKAAFKAEYIIPQLLSQYVALEKDQFVGIGYLSVSGAHYKETNQELFCNYFFPVRTSKEKGHCRKLINTFQLTKGVPWQIFEIYKGEQEMGAYNGQNEIHQLPLYFEDIESIMGFYYGDTDFGKFEKFLERRLKVQSLNLKREASIK
ncbi:hypothetical protein O0Q50_23095 [Priestia aryabhattai]|uniref:RES domain-containing protein n=1 Tax=Priestia aryabhattai TaxID=412384 RepID=A0AAX6NDS2_PRIAR|nr:hypothetical protein [Priestia aryabhattai]MDU9694073.1 hypothetical protein [Priestia aryabhattai]